MTPAKDRNHKMRYQRFGHESKLKHLHDIIQKEDYKLFQTGDESDEDELLNWFSVERFIDGKHKI